MPTLMWRRAVSEVFSELIHRAVQIAAKAHRHQIRKGSGDIPYISHPTMVALLLQRAGFEDEATVAAALLHDVAEDTQMPMTEIAQEFGEPVAALVACVTETKKDPLGQPIPWAIRKDEKHRKLLGGPPEAKAIALADMLHNLSATLLDLRAGTDVWARFNAPKDAWLANMERDIDACAGDSPGLQRLAAACRQVLSEVQSRQS
jgi:(p)ppGpp synthase/HD superfamily hydrolase